MAGKTEFMKYAYFDKEIVEFEKATVSIATHSLQYGTTCFGGVRGYYRNGKQQFLDWKITIKDL